MKRCSTILQTPTHAGLSATTGTELALRERIVWRGGDPNNLLYYMYIISHVGLSYRSYNNNTTKANA